MKNTVARSTSNLSPQQKGETVALIEYYREKESKPTKRACQMAGIPDSMFYFWRTKFRTQANAAALEIQQGLAKGVKPGPGPLLAAPLEPPPAVEEPLAEEPPAELLPVENGNRYQYPVSRYSAITTPSQMIAEEPKVAEAREQSDMAEFEKLSAATKAYIIGKVRELVLNDTDWIREQRRTVKELKAQLGEARAQLAEERAQLAEPNEENKRRVAELSEENKKLRLVLGDILINSKLKQLQQKMADGA